MCLLLGLDMNGLDGNPRWEGRIFREFGIAHARERGIGATRRWGAGGLPGRAGLAWSCSPRGREGAALGRQR